MEINYLHLLSNHRIYGQGRLSPPVTELCQRQLAERLLQRQSLKTLDSGNIRVAAGKSYELGGQVKGDHEDDGGRLDDLSKGKMHIQASP